MKDLIQQNIQTLKNLFYGTQNNETRKAFKAIFGKCSITLAKDIYGVTVITFENGDRIFLDSNSVEFKPSQGFGFAILY